MATGRDNHILQDLASLFKLRLSLSVAAAAAAGLVLAAGALDRRAGILFVCMLSIAAGAGCWNNWQDAALDAGMRRTQNRPLPAGRISRPHALVLACALLLAGGLGLVAVPFPLTAAITAGIAVLLYGAVYTPLKRHTSLALLPGVVCGSLPPLIGWLAGGGCITEPAAWSLMACFGLWQPPHFWLVVLAHPDDYCPHACLPRPGHSPGRTDSKSATATRTQQTPSMLDHFSRPQLTRILFTWIAMLGLSLLSLPLSLGITSPVLYALELANALLLIGAFGWLLPRQQDYRPLFALLNACVFTGVLLVVVTQLWPRV